MIFKCLITIVFIAEIIITWTVFSKLFHLNKQIRNLNRVLLESKNDIREILLLCKNISKQALIITSNYINTLKEKNEINLINKLNKALITILLLKLNSKFINKIRKHPTFKFLSKGFMLIENMI